MQCAEQVIPASAKRLKSARMVEQSTMMFIKDYIEGKRGPQNQSINKQSVCLGMMYGGSHHGDLLSSDAKRKIIAWHI